MFYTAKEVSEILQVGISTAYKLVHKWNEDLEAKGYVIVSGKIPKAYLEERLYGGKDEADN